jgi:arginine exporter protein ArgO
MSRNAWYLITLAVLGFLVLPSLTERLRAVRRAVGALAVYWVSLNLWGTACYLLGVSPRLPQGAQIAWVIVPPFFAVVAWLAWDQRARPRA